MYLIAPVQQSNALMPCRAPIVQEPLHQVWVLESHIVHMPVTLPVQRDGVRLALGADTSGPRRMVLAAALDATGDVLEGKELATVHSRCHPAQERVEGQVLHVLLLQVGLVERLERRAVHAATIGIMATTRS